MTINEMAVESFRNVEIGKEFTTREIRDIVAEKHGVRLGSFQPSDACYNRTNKGLDGLAVLQPGGQQDIPLAPEGALQIRQAGIHDARGRDNLQWQRTLKPIQCIPFGEIIIGFFRVLVKDSSDHICCCSLLKQHQIHRLLILFLTVQVYNHIQIS